jgi:electron transfer flavoprotein beta subunit
MCTPSALTALTVDQTEPKALIVINPWDEYAIEEATLLKDTHGGNVTVITMGPEEALEAHAVTMGCDAAICVWDENFADFDSLATSYILAQAIKQPGDVDLVLVRRGIGSQPVWICILIGFVV